MNLYNDIDPYVAEWTRNLIQEGLIPHGIVDERSIVDLQPRELFGYTQCHFFNGIAGWPEALRLAGWDPSRRCWTGSCPCPPFSVAGRKNCPDCNSTNLGFWSGPRSCIEFFGCLDCKRTDNRNLWPDFYVLIGESKPDVVFGEQVDSPLGRQWLSGIQTDLEAAGFTFGTAPLCAAGVQAPHIRQRNFWVAVAESNYRRREQSAIGKGSRRSGPARSGASCPNAAVSGRPGDVERMEQSAGEQVGIPRQSRERRTAANGMAHAPGIEFRSEPPAGKESTNRHDGETGFWSTFDVIPCLDGTSRRVISRSQLMDAGLSPDLAILCPSGVFPKRTEILKGAGNSIVPQLAAEFIKSVMEWMEHESTAALSRK